MNTWQLRFAILWVLVNGFSNFCFAAAPPDGNPRTVYFTVGDTQDLFDFPPLDSRTSIAAAFETLQQQWQVERIWWRGGQDEVWGEEFIIRPENRLRKMTASSIVDEILNQVEVPLVTGQLAKA